MDISLSARDVIQAEPRVMLTLSEMDVSLSVRDMVQSEPKIMLKMDEMNIVLQLVQRPCPV